MNKNILVLIIILLAGAVGYLAWNTYYPLSSRNIPGEQVACTMEAKLCPDGSYVGRSGPRCEFAPCPTTSTTSNTDTDIADWKTSTNPDGVLFQYPEKLSSTYITAVDWPPKVTVSTSAHTCLDTGSATSSVGITEKRMVNTHEYCRTTESEGAAGSIFNTYTYATQIEGKQVVFTFSTRLVQCANYDDPQKTECENERESFDIDAVVDRIARTVEFH